jgi:hypothetical protein
LVVRLWLNWRSGMTLRWKGEDCQLGRSRSGVWKAGTFKAVAPTCVGWELMGWPPWADIERTGRMPVIWARPADVLWIMSRAIFLRSSGSVHRCWQLHKRLLCVDYVRYIWSGTIHRLSVGYVWRVGQISPAEYTSIWITVTLGYELLVVYGRKHIENLMAWIMV